MQNFVFLPMRDVVGNELARVDASMNALAELAAAIPYCASFNTAGVMRTWPDDGELEETRFLCDDTHAAGVTGSTAGVYVRRMWAHAQAYKMQIRNARLVSDGVFGYAAQTPFRGAQLWCVAHDMLSATLQSEPAPHISNFISKFVTPGCVCVDVGAGTGVHTLDMSSACGVDGKVYAFEPQCALFVLLSKNMEAFACKNVCLFEKGLFSNNARVDVLAPKALAPSDSTICTECACVTLDDMLLAADVHRVCLLRVTAQGRELHVLQGALHLIKIARPTIIINLKEPQLLAQNSSSASVLSFLLEQNYVLLRVRAETGIGSCGVEHVCVPCERVYDVSVLETYVQWLGVSCDIISVPFASQSQRVHVLCQFDGTLERAYSCAHASIVESLLTIHVMCRNESFLLPFFVAWYRARFPDVCIIVHDNESTDDSVDVAVALGCVVQTFSTAKLYNEAEQTRVRNTAWVGDGTASAWVLVIDMDEFCDITPAQLHAHEQQQQYQVKAAGFNMVGQVTPANPLAISTGVRDAQYDKPVLFFRAAIETLEFSFGSHFCTTQFKGSVLKTTLFPQTFSLFHFHMIDEQRTKIRRSERATRRAPMHESIDLNGQAKAVLAVDAEFTSMRAKAKQVLDCRTQWQNVRPTFSSDWTAYTVQQLHVVGDDGVLPVTVKGAVLEVGCFEGRGTLALADAFANRLIICIDPWQDAYSEETTPMLWKGQYARFIMNTLPIRHRLQIHRGMSKEQLPLLQDASIAFALIDGDHAAASVFLDAELTWPKLVSGGVMVFDDYVWQQDVLPAHQRPMKGIDEWMTAHASEFILEHKAYQVRIRKK